jgi:hypothetical protein
MAMVAKVNLLPLRGSLTEKRGTPFGAEDLPYSYFHNHYEAIKLSMLIILLTYGLSRSVKKVINRLVTV